MKFAKHFPRITLKRKLLIYFVLISFIPTALISVYNYNSSSKAIEDEAGMYNHAVLQNMLELVDKQVEQVDYFTEGLLLNPDILSLLRRSPEEAMIEDELRLKMYLDLEEQFRYTSVASYMLAVLIIGDNGFINRNGPYALYYEPGLLQTSDWFAKSKENRKTMMLSSPIPNQAKASGEKVVIPVVRTINDIDRRDRVGSLVILLSEKLFGELIANRAGDSEEEVYLIDRGGHIVSSNKEEFVGAQLTNRSFMGRIADGDEPYFMINENNKAGLVVYQQSDKSGLTLIKVIPMNSIDQQKRNLKNTTLLLLFGTVCIAYLFSLFMTWNFARPIKDLIVNVKRIARGDFDQPLSQHAHDELGALSKHIQEMAAQIQVHIEDKLQEQEERRKSEIKMLQSQINPHFLYNTLSSIKWMASMQKADGIEEMAGSLGRLLHSAVGDLREKTPLSEELKMIDEYINIQRIRYKGKVKFEKQVASEELLDCPVLRFTLQPLVENAIFHGIEPKKGIGTIKILIERTDANLIIRVWDNGVGMEQEKIEEIVRSINHKPGDQRRSIGLLNVFNRIRLVYGADYGLDIASEVGMFTQVTISLPLEHTE